MWFSKFNLRSCRGLKQSTYCLLHYFYIRLSRYIFSSSCNTHMTQLFVWKHYGWFFSLFFYLCAQCFDTQLFSSEEDDTDLSDNFIVKTCQRFIPVTCNVPKSFFFLFLLAAWIICSYASSFIAMIAEVFFLLSYVLNCGQQVTMEIGFSLSIMVFGK